MNTISNERLEELANGDMEVWYSESQSMARELLALRKERERAEPVGEVVDQSDGLVMDGTVHLGGSGTHRAIKGLNKMKRMPLGTKFYTAPPAPVVPVETFEEWSRRCEIQLTLCRPEFREVAEITWNACRAAMLQPAQAETDTTEQQFESLAGKAVGGWIPCSERMPVEKDIVLVVGDGYFVCEAQYREGDFFSAARGNNEFFETICRDVELWQPLPEPPCK
ncbi:DUF551 domain-containing protein [Cronobacter sakazakii]|uniref:DUF551 domain-containing protein n=1 Tax=Cronobacter sakazakii TaxID=28141 RepID=UPI000B4B965D|nr:DUF551 domain-containing protein [Cronobacter sakazakii]EKY2038252.1 DUF551 domain-containing protein [Cronobacter sakazakii]PUW46553.1 DUF551 domain-containing protein [Cronobacter sakazakii]HAU5500043.1 DUF551 domain-containing protein [Cronobacter sakazakii]